MKSPEGMADETARDLFAMVFDDGGVAVPPDDLAPAAMAGYRRWRRWRTAAVGAGATAAVVGIASGALVVADGGSGAGTTPGVRSSAATSAQTAAASPSAAGADRSRVVDCFTNFAADGGDLAKLRADCTQGQRLWRAVFPGVPVSGARNPSFAQITNGFVALVSVQKASASALYGHAQPQVVQDWSQARQEVADAGDQSWSGFDIATAHGTIIVSATTWSAAYSKGHLPCWGATPCANVQLSDSSTAEVGGTGGVHGYTVTARSQAGDSYQFSFTSRYDPRYVDVPCATPGGHCYADLTDGSIQPGAVPDRSAIIQNSVVTLDVLTDILKRPAFAALVKGYIDGKLGKSAAGS
jgi:hypothetical protein